VRARPVPFVVAALVLGAAFATWALERGAARPVSGSGTTGSRVIDTSFRSRALGGRLGMAVYLPPGYSTARRYPVIYFLHGLPASPVQYRQVGFLVQTLDGLSRPAILVAPQGARDGDTDPEYLDWGPGRNWETAIAKEVPAYVDAHFRTIATRYGRALVGLSAGGYGAVQLALHHLQDFSVIQSWSGYHHPTNPAGTAPLDLGSPAANARASIHTLVPQLRRAFRLRPTFFAFYVGKGDTRFRDENEQLHLELQRAGVPHVFRLYPGGHEPSVWTAHARAWLVLALDHLARAR
jgi:putative tributyrin esterase